mmetsp:Transcript_42581/g.85462  ORF Transcript_42581/g.85462 Transcript_42581/m.85462 type:complete len:82 (+) Transcript_42581:411-656(+)
MQKRSAWLPRDEVLMLRSEGIEWPGGRRRVCDAVQCLADARDDERPIEDVDDALTNGPDASTFNDAWLLCMLGSCAPYTDA